MMMSFVDIFIPDFEKHLRDFAPAYTKRDYGTIIYYYGERNRHKFRVIVDKRNYMVFASIGNKPIAAYSTEDNVWTEEIIRKIEDALERR